MTGGQSQTHTDHQDKTHTFESTLHKHFYTSFIPALQIIHHTSANNKKKMTLNGVKGRKVGGKEDGVDHNDV